METFVDIIDCFGGPAKFAEAISIKGFHAQSMKERDSIPPRYWEDTVAAAKRLASEEPDDNRQAKLRSVTFAKLASIAKAKPLSRHTETAQ